MGNFSKKICRKLKKAGTISFDIPNVDELVEDGQDPTHAVYLTAQHLTSHFLEEIAQLPGTRKFMKILIKAEDGYMPSGPPMSPLTCSFFTCWEFFDFQFDDADTVATCLIESSGVVAGISTEQLEALQKMSDSRMGIYEHVGMDGELIRLKELITDEEFSCRSTSGYQGSQGELWYARLLPPLSSEAANEHIVFTTPYILTETTKEDWLQFLQRRLSQFKEMDQQEALHRFLKEGESQNYWNEFVFTAYHHYQFDAIFLAGIPDLKATLPNA